MTAVLSFTIRTVRSLSLLFWFLFTLGLVFGYARGVEAVRNGNESLKITKTIFMIGYDTAGTGGAAEYERCLVTACHVLEPWAGHSDNVYKVDADIDLTTITDDVKRQPVAKKGKLHPEYCDNDELAQSKDQHGYYDMAVLWLANYQDGDVKRIEEGRDYTPYDLDKANNILTLITSGSYSGYVDPNRKSPEAPKEDLLVGFGHNRTEEGVDKGAGVMRWGLPDANLLWSYPGDEYISAYPGSLIRADITESGRIGCKGDSGSPLIHNGKFYGVVWGSSDYEREPGAGPPPCEVNNQSYYTAFDDVVTNRIVGFEPEGTTNTNWKRINTMIQKTCGKPLDTLISGKGKVTGLIYPLTGWEDNLDISGNNGGILYGYGVDEEKQDQTEMFHEGQSMLLYAEPHNDNWELDYWGIIPSEMADCPCFGTATNPCPIHYSEMGEYTSTVSWDTTGCLAWFQLKCGNGTCDSGETHETCPEDCP